MRLQKVALAVLLFVSVSMFCMAEALPSDQGGSTTSNQGKDALLKYLIPALRSAGVAGRIYYQAICLPADYRFRFPEIRVTAPPPTEVGINAIREMLRGNDGVSVTEQTPGIISIHITKVTEEILYTRISVLNLNQDDQYSGAMAIARIEGSPEVQAEMKILDISGASSSISIILEPPAEGRPHLPPSMVNVTMDQALDVVAKTFRGVVLYGTCTQPNRYEIDLVGNMNDEIPNPAEIGDGPLFSRSYDQPNGGRTDILQQEDHGAGYSHTHDPIVNTNPNTGQTFINGTQQPGRALSPEDISNIQSGAAPPSAPKGR